jgi:hypothetical protein
LLTVVAPDIVIRYAEMPEPLHGRETWQQGFELVKRAFPDLTAELDDPVAADDKVALRLTLGGTSPPVGYLTCPDAAVLFDYLDA